MKSQRCPYCQITEALGGYCTKCLRRTQPSWELAEPTRGHGRPSQSTQPAAKRSGQ